MCINGQVLELKALMSNQVSENVGKSRGGNHFSSGARVNRPNLLLFIYLCNHLYNHDQPGSRSVAEYVRIRVSGLTIE